MTDRAATTRQQLVEMRDRLISNLGERIEGGDLTLLGAVAGALRAIDAPMKMPDGAEAMAGAVVTDIPGPALALALYGEDGKAAVIELSPIRAITLAGRLLDAALRRL